MAGNEPQHGVGDVEVVFVGRDGVEWAQVVERFEHFDVGVDVPAARVIQIFDANEVGELGAGLAVIPIRARQRKSVAVDRITPSDVFPIRVQLARDRPQAFGFRRGVTWDGADQALGDHGL